MKVLVAPTAFKGTFTATAAAEAIAEGISLGLPSAEVRLHPVADGGDGTLEVVHKAVGGEILMMQVAGPLGAQVDAPILFLEDGTVVIELARASGLGLIDEGERDAMVATTRGTGELISASLDRGPRRLIVGLGGSATVDGGLGMMRALGVGFFAPNGMAITAPKDLPFLDRIDLTFRDFRLLDTEVVAACDVTNPLLGAEGAVREFGPQKGGGPEELIELEAGMARLAEVVMRTTGRWIGESPRGGAAGGAAAALEGLAGAELAPGFEVVADLTGFDEAVAWADVVVVGEGAIDAQTMRGKAVAGAARRALMKGAEVWALAGRIDLEPNQMKAMGLTRWRALAADEGLSGLVVAAQDCCS